MFILDVIVNPNPNNGQIVNPNGQNQPAQNQPAQNTEQQRQEALKLQQELNERVQVLGDRIRGTQRNIERAERDMPGRFNIFAGGVRRGMQQSIEADRRYLSRLQSERNTQTEVQNRINRLMRDGKYEEATAVMQGREQEYRQRITQAGRQAIRDLQGANQTLAEADRRLAQVETGLRVAQRGTVIAGAIVATAATGGAGAPLLVSTVAGTAAGTGIGALTNFTEAAGHVAHGNMSAGDAFHRAAAQTGQDALTSAQIGISGGVGAAAGRALIGTAGAQVAPTLTRVVTSGMVGGGTSGLTGSVLQTGTNIALGNERRSVGEIVRDTLIQTGTGTISGGFGARGQAALHQTIAQGGTNSLARTLLIRGTTEVAAPTALTLGTHYAVHGEINPNQATQDVAMNILSSMVGARINQNHLNGTHGNNWRSNLGHEFSTPTFNSVGGSIGRLFVRQTPPVSAAGVASAVSTLNAQTTNGTSQPSTQTNPQNQPTGSTQTQPQAQAASTNGNQTPPPNRTHYNMSRFDSTVNINRNALPGYRRLINQGLELIKRAQALEANGNHNEAANAYREAANHFISPGFRETVQGLGLSLATGSRQRIGTVDINELRQVLDLDVAARSSRGSNGTIRLVNIDFAQDVLPSSQTRTRVYRELALLYGEECLHSIQAINGGPLSNSGRQHNLHPEVDVAAYYREQGVNIENTWWVSRYGRDHILSGINNPNTQNTQN